MSQLDKQFVPFIKNHDKDNWYGFTKPRMFFFNHGEVPDASFSAGFLVADEVGTMDIPHIHDGAHNFFIFTGAELDNIWEAEFEVYICLGDNPNSMEIYKITRPSIVWAPAGVWHSPVYYKKVIRGVNTMMSYVGDANGRVYPRKNENGTEDWLYEKENTLKKPCIKPDKEFCTFCGLCFTNPNQTEEDVAVYMAPFFENQSYAGKFKNCIVELPKDYHKLGDAVMNPRCAFKGKNIMDKTGQQWSINIITKPCKLGDDEPVSNGQIAEFLWFSGSDTVLPWESFDAEIEIMLGNDPEHMEAVVFDRPGVIAVPPGMWRGAITIKRVGKPLCFIPYYNSDKPRCKITHKVANGETLYIYDDETTIKNPTAGDELYLQIKR